MRVVIVGGAGVFGSRLADLLVRDGHDVTVAGRSVERTRAAADRIGCDTLVADLRAHPERGLEKDPDIVVDAAGPYQYYGSDPYRLAQACLAAGIDYLDLCDNAQFASGICELDGDARAAGRRALSGVSSVPALSSAIVADLCADLDEVCLIDTAILPGNRAPRGASVTASIVSGLGGVLPILRGGVWREQAAWSDPRRISLAPDLHRTARIVDVPDIHLFPDRFGARSAVFRAGMELPILNTGMRALAALRRRIPFEVTPARTAFFRRLADLFQPFGSDRGGMRVLVRGSRDGAPIRREWRLIAEAGEGPMIPAVAARAAIRRLPRLLPGARPCLGDIPRNEMEAAMTDLSVSTTTLEAVDFTPVRSALASRWDDLPRPLREIHEVRDVESFSGRGSVSRSASPFPNLLARLFGFPPHANDIPVTVTKTAISPEEEVWERNFDGHVFRSRVTATGEPERIRERFGPFSFELQLQVTDQGIALPVRRGWIFGVALPGWLLPVSDSREYVEDGIFRYDVSLCAPIGIGPVVRYRGWLTPDAGPR